ncbi:Ig-like domain-containing protein [Polyangium fumosum]|uniref:Uncharacterized protein n=1 Tax=Polyangium fumosum TaxID=889272 RepID=A0A4V5PPD9_9BACT|nr:hypothetical protein [Polyangium fumosum]TKD04359.1 hypothetical protein E8A74_23660 [Polyangium fumosum]
MGSPEREAIDAPPVHLVEVELSGLDAGGQPTTLTLTPSAPAPTDGSVALSTTSVRVTFDRFLLPGEAVRQAICLQPSSEPVPTLQQCRLQVFMEPSYDPVHRRITYRLPAMTALAPNTKYWLTVLAPTEASPFGVRAFDGAPFEANVVLQFTTAAMDPAGGPVDPALDEAARRAASEELFCTASACVASCAVDDQLCIDKCPVSKSLIVGCGGCHGPLEIGAAAMGLDLSGVERIPAMIGRVANQTQTGEQADEPDLKPRRFGRAMPHVDPGNAGNSYLLYKMLAGPIYTRMDAAKGLAPGEIDRLRASVVVGLPMPPYDLYAAPEASLEALSAWITTGAETPACP